MTIALPKQKYKHMKDTRISSKKCPRCKNIKGRDEFNKSLSRLDRMAVYCRKCESDYKKEREAKKKEYDIYGIF